MYGQNYPQSAPAQQGWQAPQQGGRQRKSKGNNEFPINRSQLTGTVLAMTGKPEDRIEVKQIGENNFVTHFLLEIVMPAGTDQNGQPKTKRIRRKINAFTNAKISRELLYSLCPGMTIKVTAEDADESYVDRNGNKIFREVKNAYYIEIVNAYPQPQQGQGYMPQGAPYQQQPQYAQQPMQQAQPQYGQQPYGGYPQPQGPAQPRPQAPAYQGGYQGQGWNGGAMPPQQAAPQRQPAAPQAPVRPQTPYYEAPAAPAAKPADPIDDDDLPPDIAGTQIDY